jgi:hypothetical protein
MQVVTRRKLRQISLFTSKQSNVVVPLWQILDDLSMHVMLVVVVTHRLVMIMMMVVVVVVDMISAGVAMMMMTLVIYTMVIIDFLHRVFKLDVVHSHRLVVTMVPMATVTTAAAATIIIIKLSIRPVVTTIIFHHSCKHNR